MSLPHDQESTLNRSEAVLAGLLHALGGTVPRTKLVKLTYLLDGANYGLRGQTMTGFEYIWDNYGPNAQSNGIVRRLDEMIEAGVISMREKKGTRGPAYLYRIDPYRDLASLPLSSDDWVEIHTTVYKYGKLRTEEVVKVSKDTEPMREVQQYDTLKFAQDPPLTTEEVNADPFWRETVAAMDDKSNRISIEALRSLVG